MKPYYQDELVTLYHGDCLTMDEWLAPEFLVTDPPYGMKWTSGHITRYKKNGGTYEQGPVVGIAGDASTDVRDAALAMWGTKPRMVFGTWRVARPEPVDHRLIWHKQGQAPGPANSAFMLQDEEIYVTGQGFIHTSPPMRSVITTREARSVEVAKIGHPTPKPVGLMEILIGRIPVGATIADPFAGSGATLIAARNLGHPVIGVELEERYCEMIAGRLAQGAFLL